VPQKSCYDARRQYREVQQTAAFNAESALHAEEEVAAPSSLSLREHTWVDAHELVGTEVFDAETSRLMRTRGELPRVLGQDDAVIAEQAEQEGALRTLSVERGHEVIELSAADSARVVDALMQPRPAGSGLLRAAKRYRAFAGESSRDAAAGMPRSTPAEFVDCARVGSSRPVVVLQPGRRRVEHARASDAGHTRLAIERAVVPAKGRRVRPAASVPRSVAPRRRLRAMAKTR